MKKILVAVVALLNCCALAFAQKVDVMKSDFSALEPFTITYNAGGGPQGGALPSPWGTNLWNAGSKAETGVADEPTTKMRALYMTNTEGTPAVQMFTLKPLQLKANQNYLASFIYMTEGDATGRFEVRFEGEGADKMDRVGENLDRIGIWKERVVPFTTPASGLAGFQFSTGAVGKKIYLREFHLREGPKAWKPQPEELGAPGARIDEKQIKQVFYVNPSHAQSRRQQQRQSQRAAEKRSPPRWRRPRVLSRPESPPRSNWRRVFIARAAFNSTRKNRRQGGRYTACIAGSAAGKVVLSGADAAGWERRRGRWLMPKSASTSIRGTITGARRTRCITSPTTRLRSAARCWFSTASVCSRH
jgi:hypothetical protein